MAIRRKKFKIPEGSIEPGTITITYNTKTKMIGGLMNKYIPIEISKEINHWLSEVCGKKMFDELSRGTI